MDRIKIKKIQSINLDNAREILFWHQSTTLKTPEMTFENGYLNILRIACLFGWAK
jgi:hypothetical protein